MNANCKPCHDAEPLPLLSSDPCISPQFAGHSAISQILRVIEEQSQPTFDEDFNMVSFYNWTGGNGALSPAVPNAGNGEPKAFTGLVGTHHRPSDDISVFGAHGTL